VELAETVGLVALVDLELVVTELVVKSQTC